jgi:DNA repair protein RadC
MNTRAETIPDISFRLVLDCNLANGNGSCCLPAMRCAEDVASVFNEMALAGEEFLVACAVDRRLRPVWWSVLAVGGTQFQKVRPVAAFLGAIQAQAAGVILVQNNRSARFEPGKAEGRFTAAVEHAGALLGYPLLDHVVIGRNGFWNTRSRWARARRWISAPMPKRRAAESLAHSA